TCIPVTPLVQIKRFRGKINIQRPKPPHFAKAKFIELTRPWFLSKKYGKSPMELCSNLTDPRKDKQEERNIFQEIIAQDLHQRLKTSKLVVFCHYNPMTTDQQFSARVSFHKLKMYFKQYGKKTLELAVKGTPYEVLLDFYVSHNMTIFSPEPEIKKLLQVLKKFPQLILLAGIYENRLLSKEDLVKYSKIPNIQAAQSELVHTLNTAGSQLVSSLNRHQTTLVSRLEQRASQLEDNKS
ncbi:hypothetical protein D910_03627, partial [Dendroctonus ponderosae]